MIAPIKKQLAKAFPIYELKITLCGSKPPIWRRVQVPGGIKLNHFHDVLQIVMGWTDSHLHQFGSGSRYHGPETEYYLCPYQVEEGEPGVPEEEVRLDEVLADPGDTLCYLYDFGDSWEHVIRLEAVAPWDDTAPGRSAWTTDATARPRTAAAWAAMS